MSSAKARNGAPYTVCVARPTLKNIRDEATCQENVGFVTVNRFVAISNYQCFAVIINYQ